MPELPEVEVVRRGLDAHVVGHVVESVAIGHPRAVRRHLAGATDLADALTGTRIVAARRRGKYLWLDVADAATSADAPGDMAVVVHLGMSGQMLVTDPETPDPKHLHIRVGLDDGRELRFVDQRTFGGWFLDELVAPADGGTDTVPASIAHIARDPFDPAFDRRQVVTTWRGKHTEIKRALLDQTVVSGVGNIYADESLWRSRIHGARMTDALGPRVLGRLLDAAREVMEQALAQGGTSFDALYVNVNGASGYFDRSLDAYGREGQPCPRCGTPIRREQFMNRSSFSCPRCQIRPRGA
ncbi:bifunctional DNA-formamidopyrimidine glycosylase/DNA-(apurinic or apyrimidinic site) lyase [Williamsia serinedens]|uniref:Formamidopyrimidine-DNA glycosylase n=1 Tax=Williamsia serinedens TaxID=391736 RepID=A0ABT1GVE7_9NOCA|nr:bifunctional DNA-formamidopyrimidine glycosylase/DNA-(apurinic or apyrimidinic site) lyase [Williamsia serinedens]MCP2158936.1 DNA-(apurinic or apyrimidinic site) lyase [Williamsia serinedens]